MNLASGKNDNVDKGFETHSIVINNRRLSELSGIDDVISFDDNAISVHSALGDMLIEGEELKIENFSGEKGILTVTGKINGVYYLELHDKKRTPKKRGSK